MAQLYDSDAVREAAEQVWRLSRKIEADTAAPVGQAMSAAESLRGTAARALQERTEQLGASIRTLTGELDGLTEALRRYALALEDVSDVLTAQMK